MPTHTCVIFFIITSIVIEGNRRVAALKALMTPEILSSNHQNAIRKMNYEIITSINVVVAPSREIAIRHIANKYI